MFGKGLLIYVIGFSTILLYVGLNLNTYAVDTVSNMVVYNESTESHRLATIGINYALGKVYSDTTWRGPVTHLDVATDGDGYVCGVRNFDINYMEAYSISTYPALKGDMHDTIRVHLKKITNNSFTLFAWLSDFEGNSFWSTGDTVFGRMHSNGMIHIDGAPVFIDKATTSKRFDPPTVGVGQNQAIFNNGYETGVAEIVFPTNLTEIYDAATSMGTKFNSEIWITLGDGKARISTSATGPTTDSISLTNPTVLVGNKVHVKGVLNGQLTIASASDIIIEDDIRYFATARNGNTSDDILGLVANNDVLIAGNSATNDGVYVDACIFAVNGSFKSTNSINGRFDFFGSITQKERTAFYSTSRSIRYDERLTDPNFRPPMYPGFYTKTYQIANWWESYRVAVSY